MGEWLVYRSVDAEKRGSTPLNPSRRTGYSPPATIKFPSLALK